MDGSLVFDERSDKIVFIKQVRLIYRFLIFLLFRVTTVNVFFLGH